MNNGLDLGVASALKTLALGAAAALIFVAGSWSGQEQQKREQKAESVRVLVGTGCENASPSQVMVAYEEDGFSMPCKEIERHRLALMD